MVSGLIASSAAADERLELIECEIVPKATPGSENAGVKGAVFLEVGKTFHRRPRDDGTGGWWLLPEMSVSYSKMAHVLTADIAGWQRQNVEKNRQDIR